MSEGKWPQKILSSYLKETPKQYIEIYYKFLHFSGITTDKNIL